MNEQLAEQAVTVHVSFLLGVGVGAVAIYVLDFIIAFLTRKSDDEE